MRSRIGLDAAIMAASMLSGLAVAERHKPDPAPEPSDDPRPDERYAGGIDYGSKPARSVRFDGLDQQRIAAAQAKRERKAAKRAAQAKCSDKGDGSQ